MIEIAASPAYKDLLEAIGKLADWTEQAGSGHLPSGPPPAELVQQFNDALAANPSERAEFSVQSAESVSHSEAPKETLSNADLAQESQGIETTSSDTPDTQAVEQPRRPSEALLESQEVHLERSMQDLDAVPKSQNHDFFRSAKKLSELLSRPAAEISPMDLLQAQRLVGILRVDAEGGRKLSEGVGDTLEQLLGQQS